MLYHFPKESPEELFRKEEERNRKAANRASRVERFGYQRAELIQTSSYIEWRCVHEYLKCPITKWSLPASSSEKVDFEPLPTKFLPALKPYKPLTFYDPVLKEHIRRVVGYREILSKREHVEYLKEVEDSYKYETVDKPFKAQEHSRINMGLGIGVDEENNFQEDVVNGNGNVTGITREHSDKIVLSLQFLRLARGGGKDKKDHKADQKKKQTKAALREMENQENLGEVFTTHKKFRVPAAKERDTEWLQLSGTDSDDDDDDVMKSTFDKEKLDWMVDGISFESQFLANMLQPYSCSAKATGRSFLTVRADNVKRQMDFSFNIKEPMTIIFIITSSILYFFFCLMVVSLARVQWGNQETLDIVKGEALEETFRKRVAKARRDLEEHELDKYNVCLYAIMINLTLVSIWSLMVVFGDGFSIANYLNSWCEALSLMETSGSLEIRKLIINFHLIFTFYAVTIFILFMCNYPAHIRESSGLFIQLIFHVFISDLQINSDKDRFPFQIIGLLLHLYVTYCTLNIKMIMQILSLILKNASEMWNFKFALTFNQLGHKSRGQLQRIGLNHSLTKLFVQHRILTNLLKNFSEVFATPMAIYMALEMGVLTVAMVGAFFYKQQSKDDFGGNDFVSVKSTHPEPSELRIPLYHTADHVYFMYSLVIAQLVTQFLHTTEALSKAGASFFAGYEFVRRSGTILCRNSHQRRLIQSLEWSFSSTNPSVLSADSYFAVNRATILSAFAAVVGFFSLIIQLQVTQQEVLINFLEPEDCLKLPYNSSLVKGECVNVTTIS